MPARSVPEDDKIPDIRNVSLNHAGLSAKIEPEEEVMPLSNDPGPSGPDLIAEELARRQQEQDERKRLARLRAKHEEKLEEPNETRKGKDHMEESIERILSTITDAVGVPPKEGGHEGLKEQVSRIGSMTNDKPVFGR